MELGVEDLDMEIGPHHRTHKERHSGMLVHQIVQGIRFRPVHSISAPGRSNLLFLFGRLRVGPDCTR